MPKKKGPSASEIGAKGGAAKVPKGFAMLSKKKRSAIAKQAAAKRWGKEQ